MARVHGKDISSLSVDSAAGTPADMLADTKELGFKVSAATHDTTTLGDDWFESIAGLKGGDEFDHVLMYDNTTTTGNWAVYTARLGVIGTLSFGDGTRTVSMETLCTALSLPVNVGEMLQVTATHKITGAVSFT